MWNPLFNYFPYQLMQHQLTEEYYDGEFDDERHYSTDDDYSSGYQPPQSSSRNDVGSFLAPIDVQESDVEELETTQTIVDLSQLPSHKRRRNETPNTEVSPQRSGSRERSRGWCFTLNNPIASGESFSDFLRSAEGIRAFVFQLEKGASGTRHFQGYLQYASQVGFNRVKTLLQGAHIEKAQGTAEQNLQYCTKIEGRLEGPWTFGDFKSKGLPGNVTLAAEKLKNGASYQDIANEFPDVALRYASAISKFKRVCPPPPLERALQVFLFIGPTGTGKTHDAVRKDFNPEGDPNLDVYLKNPDEWFDGYMGQEVAVLDDFAGRMSRISLMTVLRMLDIYRMQVPVKGSYEWWTPHKIVVTTNIHPWNWYLIGDRMESYRALTRRFCGIRIYLTSGTYIEKSERSEIEEFFNDPEKFGYFKDTVPDRHAPLFNS